MRYANPVYPDYFADPFVLRCDGGAYVAYGTTRAPGRTVPALASADLVRWRPLGDVLEPLAGAASYWAPEVAVADGGFHMYYSAGGREGEGHRLRLAVAERPEGPFVDQGLVLDPDDPFTIDAHPFLDDDGSRYLYYCRDFLDGDRPGTGIVVDRLLDPRTLAGERRVVVRPYADWNLFERDRLWYGRRWDAWYTIEGPFVRKHGGRYYCFFSGGAWRAANYGVAYAVAAHPLGPWEVAAGGEPVVLATVPGEVHGPGHASVVESPSGASDWIVYHGWAPGGDARLMRIDRLEWTPDGPRCAGPTTRAQPAPD